LKQRQADRNWIKYLECYDYGKKMPEGVICINTGGDGGMTLKLKVIED